MDGAQVVALSNVDDHSQSISGIGFSQKKKKKPSRDFYFFLYLRMIWPTRLLTHVNARVGGLH